MGDAFKDFEVIQENRLGNYVSGTWRSNRTGTVEDEFCSYSGNVTVRTFHSIMLMLWILGIVMLIQSTEACYITRKMSLMKNTCTMSSLVCMCLKVLSLH